MKKLIAISISLVLFATVAFAETKFSAWTYGGWTVLEGNADGDINTTLGGAGYPFRAAVVAAGQTEGGIFGYDVGINAGWNGGGHSDGDFKVGSHLADIWWQPISQFKLLYNGVGWEGQALRGQIGTGSDLADWNGTGLGGGSAKDKIFTEFGHYANDSAAGGVFAEVKPIDGLYVGVYINPNKYAWNVYNSTGKAQDVYGGTDVAVGYTIEGIGLARVGFFGANNHKTGANVIEAAFSYTGMENIGFEFGVKVPLVYTDVTETEIQDAYRLTAAFNMNAGDFGIWAFISDAMLGSETPKGGEKQNIPFQLEIGLKPSYNLGIVTAGLLAEFIYTARIDDNQPAYTKLSITPHILKTFAGGQVEAGVVINYAQSSIKGGDATTAWSIPILFDIWGF